MSVRRFAGELRLVISIVVLAGACRGGESKKDDNSGRSMTVPPDDMVVVPSGQFLVTAPNLKAGQSCNAEVARALDGLGSGSPPQSLQDVKAFAIDRRRVSCRDFASCIQQAACPPSERNASDCYEGDANATREQATAFCSWRGHQLPTFLQWQAAARGTDGARMIDALCSPKAEPRVCQATSAFGIVLSSGYSGSNDDEFTRTSDCFAYKWFKENSFRPVLATAYYFEPTGEHPKFQLDLESPDVGDAAHPVRKAFRCANDSTIPSHRVRQ